MEEQRSRASHALRGPGPGLIDPAGEGRLCPSLPVLSCSVPIRDAIGGHAMPHQAIVYLRHVSQKSATNLGEIGVEPLPAGSPLKQGSLGIEKAPPVRTGLSSAQDVRGGTGTARLTGVATSCHGVWSPPRR